MTSRLALSMGDPAGIGPELILKLLDRARPDVEIHVFGIYKLFEIQARALGLSEEVLHRAVWADLRPSLDPAEINPGRSDRLAGTLQIEALEAAIAAVLRGEADALCTAPITKASARDAGFPFPGHTELLAHRCGVGRTLMMLAGRGPGALRVVPVTGHIPLREVSRSLTVERVAEALVLTAEALWRDLGIPRARVALCGLNPHAGEQGMLGKEERQVLEPGLALAHARLQDQGLAEVELVGPLPADGLFLGSGRFDAVVTCYHDQAMIPLKLLHRDDGVNFTLGLPMVRTSPAHGSALDIAGQGVARVESMEAAALMAAQIAARRKARRISGPARPSKAP